MKQRILPSQQFWGTSDPLLSCKQQQISDWILKKMVIIFSFSYWFFIDLICHYFNLFLELSYHSIKIGDGCS